ncbi:MAG: NADH:flavin oxidoreductase [Clostridia bacterium]|nr:NADH:flavin oxidoreductase [Clostridia bacterium]MDE7328849.1 NADH:flavin oxidoreductase [Clostridia bacterium]
MELFEPCLVGKVNLKNRIIRSATHDGLADEYGGPSDKLISKYAFMAKNEVGCIIAGYAIVSKEGSSAYPRCLTFYDERARDSYTRLTEAVHSYGTPIIAQLAHCGRQTSSKVIGMKKIAPSAKRHLFYPDKAKAMTVEDILRVEEAFADSIAKAKEYGFDGAQIHLAHGYLLHDFISRNGNKRKDEYGKDIYGRLRIVKEIIEKARAKAGDFPIWVKLSATDRRKKGMRIEYSIEVCKLLKEYGVDAIEVSCGSVQDGMNTMRSKRMPMDAVFEYKEPVASMPKVVKKISLACAKAVNPLIPQPKPLTMFNYPAAMAIKDSVEVDLILVGGVAKREDMQKAVDSGINAVSMCRPFICEPNFAKKLKDGKTNVSQCVMCNYCGLVIEKGETKCSLGKIKRKDKSQ